MPVYRCVIQEPHPGLTSWGILSRPCGTFRVIEATQDLVLGYFQPSLRDCFVYKSYFFFGARVWPHFLHTRTLVSPSNL
jgi:hypothetical protein